MCTITLLGCLPLFLLSLPSCVLCCQFFSFCHFKHNSGEFIVFLFEIICKNKHPSMEETLAVVPPSEKVRKPSSLAIENCRFLCLVVFVFISFAFPYKTVGRICCRDKDFKGLVG